MTDLCEFCGLRQLRELYQCPRCEIKYCSIKCYRNKKHATCSEQFYKEQVRNELAGKRCETSKGEEYDEKLRKYINGDWSGIEEGEPLDSDDDYEEENAWKKQDESVKIVVQSAIDDYELDDAEIERRMIAMGLSDNFDELLGTLTEDEREVFKRLAQEMQEEELELGKSCFSNQT